MNIPDSTLVQFYLNEDQVFSNWDVSTSFQLALLLCPQNDVLEWMETLNTHLPTPEGQDGGLSW